jgi:ribonuclease P protein component
MALKRALRLRNRKDFQRVWQQGRSTASRLLILASVPNGLAIRRIGFVVSKRVSKHAVKRNYVKRVLSEAVRPFLADIPAGWDLVISAKPPTVGANLADLAGDLQLLLKRAGFRRT